MILFQDVLSAIRWLRRRPGVPLFTLATLGIGIGAATAVFTLVNAVLLRALPFRDPDRLVWLWNARMERDRAPFSLPDLEDYRSLNHVLEGLAPFTNWTANLTGSGEAERLEGVRVAPEFFELLGTRAAAGRLFSPGDDPAERAAILTDRLWRRRFGSDPSTSAAPSNSTARRTASRAFCPRGLCSRSGTRTSPCRCRSQPIPAALSAAPAFCASSHV